MFGNVLLWNLGTLTAITGPRILRLHDAKWFKRICLNERGYMPSNLYGLMPNKFFYKEYGVFKNSCLLLAALLIGCSSQPSRQELMPTNETARIRLFGQNGVMVKLYRNGINGKGGVEVVSGGMGSAFASFTGTVSNQSIGIPDTPNVKNLSERGGILSKAYFREYMVKAGQPLTLSMSFRSSPGHPGATYTYCKTALRTFIPEAGMDYEAALDIEPGFCAPRINQILTRDNEVVLVPVEYNPSESLH